MAKIELVYDLKQYSTVLHPVGWELKARGYEVVSSTLKDYNKGCAATVGCQAGPWLDTKPFDKPSFLLQHGLSPMKRWNHKFLLRHWSYMIAAGPLFYRAMAPNSTSEVLQTGWTKADIYMREKHKKDEYRSKIRKEHNLDSRPIVLFAPTYIDSSIRQYPGFTDHLDDILSMLNKDYNVMFMQHQMCKHKITSNVFNPKEDEDKHKYILGCDILISDISSVLFEACLIDTPVVMIDNKNIPNYHRDKVGGELIDLGSIVDFKDVRDAVDLNLKNPELFANRREYWNNEVAGYSLDGKAASRLVDKIEEVI